MSVAQELIAMSFSKFHRFDELDESSTDWCIHVRAQAVWKGVNKKTKEFRGYNIISIDDSNCRIHAFVYAQLCLKLQTELVEGQVFVVHNFAVKKYNGDETHRAVRNETHIYFTQETKFLKDSEQGLEILPQTFDLFKLSDVGRLKQDNRYLIDVVGVLEGTPSKIEYKKDELHHFYVKFIIIDGRCSVNVTLFNEFGQSFLDLMDPLMEQPVIIIITSANINEWNDEISHTNYPATRFYLNHDHSAVKKLRTREKEAGFYVVDIDDSDEDELPHVTVKELLELKDDYIKQCVQSRVILRKVEQHMNWFHLFTLCSDNTGTVPITLPNEEVIQLIGRTVYDILADDNEVGDGDKFPGALTGLQKKYYDITISISEENVKQGSQVFNATKISKPLEISATNSPGMQTSIQINSTAVPTESAASKSSPPTGNSRTKIRARKHNEALECGLRKNVKVEKFKGKFPTTFKKLENAQFTVKLKIHKDNIGNSEELYLATDNYQGFEREEVNEDEETTIRPTEHSISEPSTSASYHLDNISQPKGN
ncbi:hypothetical protein ACET3Z_027979 [Daucus carota]